MLQQQNSTTGQQPSTLRIRYTRWMGANYVLSGTICGEKQVQVRRHNQVVTVYVVQPDAGQTNLSFHNVDESEVVEIYDPLAGLTAFLKALRTQARIQQLQQDIPAEVARAAFLPGGEFYKPDSGDDSEVGE